MTPKLYMSEICPSVRAVLLTAGALGVTLELKQVELGGKSPKLLLKYSLPILEDNHFTIWDSHAIIAYLIGKYGQDDSLYPKNNAKKALVDQRLNFDSGVLSFFTETILPLIRGKSFAISQDFVESFENTYSIVEKFFDGNKWIAGDSLTIADLSLIPSITSLDVLVKIDENKYPEIISWIKRAEQLPCYGPNETGLNKLKEIVRSRKF